MRPFARRKATLQLVPSSAHQGRIAVASRVPRLRVAQLASAEPSLDETDLHLADIAAELDEFPESSAIAAVAGASVRCCCVPMLKERAPDRRDRLYRAGGAAVHRQADRAGQTFAAQAVIAIENTRLLNELRESAAAADRHRRRAQGHQPLDLRPASGARYAGRSAARLCEADMASVASSERRRLPYVTSYGHSREFDEFMREHPIHLARRRSLGERFWKPSSRSGP